MTVWLAGVLAATTQGSLLGQQATGTLLYDDIIETTFAADLVSYWKFQGDGVDAKGTQNAAITGSPETGVATIVDLDTITEGAGADGTCIAWPGTSGVYAEAAHNAAHKTAAGTIIITFQRDAEVEKSTLVCADASAAAGGLSVEVQTNGAYRAFLRGSTGSLTVLLGSAGAVQLDQAYTLIFKWGAAGLSLALWDDSGNLVEARQTNALADGVTGTSVIRFGAWHTDISHHDGPYGRVVWLDRRISDTEEADLARARTIPHSSGVSEYITTPEDHGWSAGNSAAENRTAFSAAITAASSNAGSSSTGRGVVELTPGKVYTCIPAGNGVNADPDAAINLTSATPNVEIRTRNKPPIGGNQAILQFDTWSGYSGVHNRAILELRDVTNIVLGWLTLDGNKLSAGSSYASRTTWLQNNVDYGHGGNGGIHNLAINGGSGIRLYQVESKDAIVDGLRLSSGVQVLTDFRAEDCDFHHCRRQGMTLVETENTAATYDDIFFLRSKFRETGEQSDMRGEAPGCGLDVEPIGGNGSLKVYGFTLDACDISDSHGYTIEKGVLFSQQLGRGLTYGGAPVLRYHRIVNSFFERNRVAGLVFNTDNTAVIPQMRDFEIGNNVIRDNGQEGGNPNYMEFRSTVGADNLGTFFNFLIYNNEFTIGGSPNGGYNFQTRAADSGHLVSIYYGNFATNINTITNGQTTITTFLGFPN